MQLSNTKRHSKRAALLHVQYMRYKIERVSNKKPEMRYPFVALPSPVMGIMSPR